jgi:ABC-type branched-subunit amino acid transport system ATPase component
MDSQGRKITYFDTFEAREAAFNRFVARLIPSKTAGPNRFWQEFRRIADQGLNQPPDRDLAYIMANPRDGLVFGSPFQVLAAARMVAGLASPGDPEAIAALATEYGLRDQLTQAMRSLSGGETVKLALARAKAGAAGSRALVIASPFCWLSRWNTGLLNKTISAFQARRREVHLLALSGEDDTNEIAPARGAALPPGGPAFGLEFKGARIRLGLAVDAIQGPPPFAAIADGVLQLKSPCLVSGDNGQGKTLVAKALCGAVAVRGCARVSEGPSRLLFQNVITQTLLRSPETLRDSAQDICGRAPLEHVLTALIDAFQIHGGEYDRVAPTTHVAPTAHAASTTQVASAAVAGNLLVAKLYMVAARLCGRPALLILDEPDWGLSRREAAAFVLAVTTVAHASGVALMLVSHKPWWRSMAASHLRVEKCQDHQAASDSEPGQPRFTISLRPRRSDIESGGGEDGDN